MKKAPAEAGARKGGRTMKESKRFPNLWAEWQELVSTREMECNRRYEP